MTTGLIGDGISGDKRVGELERELGLPPGTVRNKDGRDTRSDKKVATIRREMRPKTRRQHRMLSRLRRMRKVEGTQQPMPIIETPVTTGEGEIDQNRVEHTVTS